jgi:hypothetical protein
MPQVAVADTQANFLSQCPSSTQHSCQPHARWRPNQSLVCLLRLTATQNQGFASRQNEESSTGTAWSPQLSGLDCARQEWDLSRLPAGCEVRLTHVGGEVKSVSGWVC